MRHLRWPQRFHPGLEGGELFPPGHDASRRAWSSFGRSSFSSSLAGPSHSPRGQRYGHAVPCGTPSPRWLAPCPRAARTRGAAGHLRRRPGWTAGELGERGHGQIRQAPSADTRADLLPLRLRQPVGIAQHVKFHPQQAVGTVAAQSGRAMPLSSTARRNARTQMRRPARQAPALPGPERHQMLRRSWNKTDPLPLSRWAR